MEKIYSIWKTVLFPVLSFVNFCSEPIVQFEFTGENEMRWDENN